jgi:L-ascorbate metabolism protein UlaG (beta-lactamase superfamily)
MTLTYFGHSAFQIETGGTVLLVDPFISDNPHAQGVVSVDDLSPDVLLLTHAHGDHWGDSPAIIKRAAPLVIGQYEVTNYVQAKHGHEKVHPMNTGGSASFEWGRVTMTWARHSSSFPDGTYGGVAAGYILELDGVTIYAAGDTDRFAEMAWYGEEFDIDLALLPAGDDFTMGPAEAVKAAQMLKAGLCVPIHWGTFPLLTGDPDDFVERMGAAGMQARRLNPGENLAL